MKKQVHLTLVEHSFGKNDRTIATVRGTKHGKQAELAFIGNQRVIKFPTVQKAWEWLAQNTYQENRNTYFQAPENSAF